MQNKLIALILLTALVGCSQYDSYRDCMNKRTEQHPAFKPEFFSGEFITNIPMEDQQAIHQTCRALFPVGS
tara:strand:- start:66 stop:278 length:213 start_codon:yes stop_codon:yes gene_type:complete